MGPGKKVVYAKILLDLFSVLRLSTEASECLTNELCQVHDGPSPTIRHVDSMTYCCRHQNDYIDMTLTEEGNVTCQCTTASKAAAEYADSTMGEGRVCNWGADCEGVDGALTLKDTHSFCCLGNGHQYIRTTHFGAEEVVCRCQGSKMLETEPDRYIPPPTNKSSTSGEVCSYNHDCADFPSVLCWGERAMFCCYGSRGVETLNDPDTNTTYCTCTNEFTGTNCAEDPYPVDVDTEDAECRSGNACKRTSPQFSCSHGDVTFCCPQQGVNLTIVDDIITSCTCLSAGRLCNVTSTTSNDGMSWRSCATSVFLMAFIITVLI